MYAQRLPDERLVVPMRAEGPGVIGDSLAIIDERHPGYAAWAEGRPTFAPPGGSEEGRGAGA